MKKIALSLAGVLAAAAFAPEASAVPSFARQTGMACSSCHFMKYPTLNGFGRAFKAAGYTMMGAQEKVEGEHLSIPGVLNGSILFKYRYMKDSGPKAIVGYRTDNVGAFDEAKVPVTSSTLTAAQTLAGSTFTAATPGKNMLTSAVDGQWQMADEMSLFFGGRIAETEHFTIGFLNENNMAAGGVAGLRVPVNFDLGVAKITVVPFTTDALGVAYGFELSSGGIMRANRWAEARREISAVQYNADRGADGGAAAGTAFVVQNDMGFINLTKWSSSFTPGANGQGVASTNYGQNYIRVAATPSIAGFDIVAGVGVESGSSYGNLADKEIESKQTFVDFQAQGEVAGMEAELYIQNAKAPKLSTGLTAGADSAHNSGGAFDRTATTIGGEVGVIPHVLTLGAAYRSAKSGAAGTGGAGDAATTESRTDNALTLVAVYDLVQNVALHATYVKFSGTNATRVGGTTSRFLGMLEAAW